jgi:hypothetical protein
MYLSMFIGVLISLSYKGLLGTHSIDSRNDWRKGGMFEYGRREPGTKSVVEREAELEEEG